MFRIHPSTMDRGKLLRLRIKKMWCEKRHESIRCTMKKLNICWVDFSYFHQIICFHVRILMLFQNVPECREVVEKMWSLFNNCHCTRVLYELPIMDWSTPIWRVCAIVFSIQIYLFEVFDMQSFNSDMCEFWLNSYLSMLRISIMIITKLLCNQ